MPLRNLAFRIKSIADLEGIQKLKNAIDDLSIAGVNFGKAITTTFSAASATIAATTAGVLGTVEAFVKGAVVLKTIETVGEFAAKRIMEFAEALGISAAQAEKLEDILKRQGRTRDDFLQLLEIERQKLGENADLATAYSNSIKQLGIDIEDVLDTEIDSGVIARAAAPDPGILAEWKDIFSTIGIAAAEAIQPIEEVAADVSNAIGGVFGFFVDNFVTSINRFDARDRKFTEDRETRWQDHFRSLIGFGTEASGKLTNLIDTETESYQESIRIREERYEKYTEDAVEKSRAYTRALREIYNGYTLAEIKSNKAMFDKMERQTADFIKFVNTQFALLAANSIRHARRVERAWLRAQSVATGTAGNPAAQGSIGGLGLEGEVSAFESALPQIRADNAERGLERNAPGAREDEGANWPEGVI